MANPNQQRPVFNLADFVHILNVHDRSISVIVEKFYGRRIAFVCWYTGHKTPEELFTNTERLIRGQVVSLAEVNYKGMSQDQFFLDGDEKDCLVAIFDAITTEMFGSPKQQNLQAVMSRMYQGPARVQNLPIVNGTNPAKNQGQGQARHGSN